MNIADTLTVPAAGVDTWSPAWTIDSKKLDDQIVELFNIQGPAGSRMLKDPTPSGHRLGYFPHAGFMFAEGHPAGDKNLANGNDLGDHLVGLELELSQLGLHMGGTKFAGLRRLDATADLRFADKSAGVIALAVLAAIQYPRVKVETIRAVGDSRVETVLLKGRAGRKTLGRMYDKGVESASAPPGSWTRFEDQRRFAKVTRPQVSEMTAVKVRERFHQRFVPLYQASKGVTVAGPLVLAQQLDEMLTRGEITLRQAERLAGYITMQGAGVAYPRSTMYARRAEARELGLYSDSGLDESLEHVEVDVSELLEAALDSDGWGVG